MTSVTGDDDGADQPMTMAAYAVHIGKSRPYVSKLVADGRITARSLTVDRKIIPSLADADIAAMADPARGTKDRPIADDSTYARQRARKAAADAEMAEMDLKVRKGELLRKAAVAQFFGPRLRELRDQLMGVPRDTVLDPVQADACEVGIVAVLTNFSAALQGMAEAGIDGGEPANP